MPATIIPFTSATTLLGPAERRDSASRARKAKRARVKSVDEPETQLWKACARQPSRCQIIIELIIFAIFVVISLAPIACFFEVKQRTDAIEQAAVEALSSHCSPVSLVRPD
jgi:hypothetical protein